MDDNVDKTCDVCNAGKCVVNFDRNYSECKACDTKKVLKR